MKRYKEVITPSGTHYESTDDPNGLTEIEIMEPKSSWDISLLSEEDFEEIKNHVASNNYIELIKIHNKYLFLGRHVCCESKLVYHHFKIIINGRHNDE